MKIRDEALKTARTENTDEAWRNFKKLQNCIKQSRMFYQQKFDSALTSKKMWDKVKNLANMSKTLAAPKITLHTNHGR